MIMTADNKPTYEELEAQNRELKKQNDALNKYYRSVVDNSMDAILLTAPDGNVFFANRAACDLFQMTQQEIIDGGRMAVLDEAHDRLPKALEVRKKTGKFVGELNYKKKDGTIFPGETSSAMYTDADGQSLTSMIIRDVTERKKMEEALKEKSILIQTILDNLPIGLAFNNINEGHAIYINKKFTEIYGWPEEEITSVKTFFQKVYPDETYRNKLSERIMADINSGIAENMHWENLEVTQKNGNKRIVNAVNIPLFEQNTMISTVIDITELKQIENELIQAKEKAEDSEKQFRALVNESPFPIVVVDTADENILHWSKSAQNMFGHDPKTVAEWYTLAYPDPHYRQEVIDRWKPYLEQAHHAKTSVNTGEYHITCRDGSIKICEIYAQFIHNRFVVTLNNITERKKAKQALKASEQKYVTLFENLIDQVHVWKLIKNERGEIKGWVLSDINPAALRAWGKIKEEVLGKTPNDILRYDAYSDFMPIVEKIFTTGKSHTAVKYFEPKDQYLSMDSIPFGDHFISVVRDITEQKKAEEKLHKMVKFDALTQAYSRRHLLELAEKMFMRIKQNQIPLICMMFDIDHFKSINDKYGHKAGDIALIAFSDVVSKNLRSNDIFGRLGGEEFLAVVPDISLEEGQNLAERIRIEVEKMPIMAGADCITMTVSIGISIYKKNKSLATFNELMELSDQALYAAKNSGRNRVCVDNT